MLRAETLDPCPLRKLARFWPIIEWEGLTVSFNILASFQWKSNKKLTQGARPTLQNSHIRPSTLRMHSVLNSLLTELKVPSGLVRFFRFLWGLSGSILVLSGSLGFFRFLAKTCEANLCGEILRNQIVWVVNTVFLAAPQVHSWLEKLVTNFKEKVAHKRKTGCV